MTLDTMSKLSLGLAILGLLYGAALISIWDYEEARMRECRSLGLSYNFSLDICNAPTEENRQAR